MKEIMPLTDDTKTEDEEDDEETGGPGPGPSAGRSGDKTPMPRTPAGSPVVTEDSDKGDKTSGTKSAKIVEEVVPHCVIIKGEDGRTYGSYDLYYPFLSTKKKLIPHNPLTHCSNVMHCDFVAAGVDDPRLEDVNTIIAVAAHGILSKSFRGQIFDRNEGINDSTLCPSLEKWNVTRTVTKHGDTAIRVANAKKSVPQRPMLLALPGLTYTKNGWVGKRGYDARAYRGDISPPTRILVQPKYLASQYVRIPKRKAKFALENLSESFMMMPMSQAKLAKLRADSAAASEVCSFDK